MAPTVTAEIRPTAQPAQTEAREAFKSPKASDQLVAQLALGNLKKDAQPGEIESAFNKQNPKPKDVSEDTYKALKARHDAQREADRALLHKQLQNEYDEASEEERQKKNLKDIRNLNEADRRNAVMTEWAMRESYLFSQEIQLHMQYHRDAQAKELVKIFTKLGFTIDTDHLDDQKLVFSQLLKGMYDPQTRQEGAFYKNYCTGDANKAFLQKLSVDEMIVVEGFLTRVLGSKTAFDALLATKQAQERLKDTSTPLSPTTDKLKPGEDKILDFLAGAPVKKDDEAKAKRQEQRQTAQEARDAQNEEKKQHRAIFTPQQIPDSPQAANISTPLERAKHDDTAPYTESLLAEADKQVPPPLQVLARQVNKAAEHLRREGITNPQALAVKLAQNFIESPLYNRMVEQENFWGPKDFERSEDRTQVIQQAKANEARIKDLGTEAQNKGFQVDSATMPGWTHYFSPNYPTNHETAYRIYLNPDTRFVPQVLESLVKYGETHTLYFKAPTDNDRFIRTDKIVLYLNKDNADAVTHFIQDQLLTAFPDAFKDRLVSGSSTVPLGPGIGLAAQPARDENGAEITGGKRNAEKIRSAILDMSINQLTTTTQKYASEDNFVHSPEAQIFREVMEFHTYSAPEFKNNPQVQQLMLESLLRTIYRHKSSLGFNVDSNNSPILNIPKQEVRNIFLQLLKQHQLDSVATTIESLSPVQYSNKHYEYNSTVPEFSLMRFGLATGFAHFTATNQEPGNLFLNQQPVERELPQLTTDKIAIRNKEKYPGGNEDSGFLSADYEIGGIFDGMGGHVDGDKASKVSRDFLRAKLSDMPANASLDEVKRRMEAALQETHDAVNKLYPGAGTTASVFKIWQGPDGKKKIVFANVGDSRIWIRKKDNTVIQLTYDDNILKRDFYLGLMSESEYIKAQKTLDGAKTPGDLSRTITLNDGTTRLLSQYWDQLSIFRSIGAGGSFGMDPVRDYDIEDGDIIILTTDGVHDNLTSVELAHIALATTSPEEITDKLVQAAEGVSEVSRLENIRSKTDDITAAAYVVSNKNS